MSNRLRIALIAAAVVSGCSGQGPTLEPVGDHVAAVGEELIIELRASNAAGESIDFGFSSNAPEGHGATLTKRPDGTGLFTWTPRAADVGTWIFDFTASDGGGETTESVSIEVRSAVGSQSFPTFRRPLGAGTAVDMLSGGCVEIETVVTDQDSTAVTFTEEEPKIEGATLFQESDLQAIWRWCPNDEQIRAQERYLLTLAASDSVNPKAVKRYQIILRDPSVRREECAGEAPAVVHTPANKQSINPLAITAQVTDDSGLKAAPLVYHSTTPPADPPDLTKMVQLNMVLDDGDTRAGTWKVELPNPIAGIAAGTEATVYYVIVAEDNDDSGGKCDHIALQIHQMVVTAPGGEGGLGACEACTGDAQCGGPEDHCLAVGVEGESFCMTSCSGEDDCGEGFVCSPEGVTSIEGAAGRQCVPVGGQCGGGDSCPDDSFEQNDGRSQAQELERGTTDSLRMCPVGDVQADEDWYQFTVIGDTETTVAIAGDTYPNMELNLVDADGRLLAASEDWGSDDDIERCLVPGTYFVRVYSYFTGENDYSVELTTTAGDCRDDGGDECTDDAFEDDDEQSQARVPDFEDQVFRATDNEICSGDDDYFFITLFEGETIWTTLDFEQLAPDGDLDLLVYDSSGTLLTPCTEDDPSGCDAENGQSGDGDEQMVFTAPAFGEYYVVVHGWALAENTYDICIGLTEGLCSLE